MARDQLGDQAEREELDPDDDEQHAEDQQRPAADRVADDLHDGQVDQDPGAAEREREAEASEQVERPVAVAADERHGEQVEEPAHVALEPVPRAAVLARPVVDRQLGDRGSRAGRRAPG